MAYLPVAFNLRNPVLPSALPAQRLPPASCAQHNIGTTTRHVGSDSDRRWITSLRNDTATLRWRKILRSVRYV